MVPVENPIPYLKNFLRLSGQVLRIAEVVPKFIFLGDSRNLDVFTQLKRIPAQAYDTQIYTKHEPTDGNVVSQIH